MLTRLLCPLKVSKAARHLGVVSCVHDLPLHHRGGIHWLFKPRVARLRDLSGLLTQWYGLATQHIHIPVRLICSACRGFDTSVHPHSCAHPKCLRNHW